MSKINSKIAALSFTWLLTLLVILSAKAQQRYFDQGYAHNDYLHGKPLFEALGNGYTHIEADVFLLKDSLVVAHWFPYLKNNRTLESLYLAPLKQMFHRTNADLGLPPVTLVIDIKSSPKETYLALRPLLEKYRSLLSVVQNGIYKQGRVNIVLTGNRPVDLVSGETNRLVMLDDLLNQPSARLNDHLFSMASCKYSKVLQWTGKGTIPVKEKTGLLKLVKTAHGQGKKVRLWASPENENVWRELLNCGVDYINTDQLARLKTFYDAHFFAAYAQAQLPEVE